MLLTLLICVYTGTLWYLKDMYNLSVTGSAESRKNKKDVCYWFVHNLNMHYYLDIKKTIITIIFNDKIQN